MINVMEQRSIPFVYGIHRKVRSRCGIFMLFRVPGIQKWGVKVLAFAEKGESRRGWHLQPFLQQVLAVLVAVAVEFEEQRLRKRLCKLLQAQRAQDLSEMPTNAPTGMNTLQSPCLCGK